MIDFEETKLGNEKPTETDVRLMFIDLKKPMKALQSLLVKEKEELESNGVDARCTAIYITDGEILLSIGNKCLRYEEREHTFTIGE